jgi:hypothetical protein
VINVDGGTSAWIEAGKPLAVPEPGTKSRILARSQWAHAGVRPGAA